MLFRSDVAQAFINALEDHDSFGKVYELTGPHVYTLRQLLHLAGTYSAHPRPVIGLPDSLARLQAFFLEHVPGGPLMSRDNLDSMKSDNLASGKFPVPAGWRPTPLEAIAPQYLSGR